MLPSQNEYFKWIHQDQELSDEAKQKVQNFENYILHSKEQEPYITPENQKIVDTYAREIAFLQEMQGRNQNQEATLQRSIPILNTLSFEEQKQIEEEKRRQQEQRQELRTQQSAFNNIFFWPFLSFFSHLLSL